MFALVSAVVLGRLRGVGWGRAIRVLAPLGALVIEGWPALIGTVLVQEASLWLAGRLTAPCQRASVRRLFLAAYGLRVVIALPTHYYYKLIDGNGALFQDDYTNDLVGEWLGPDRSRRRASRSSRATSRSSAASIRTS